MILRFLRLFAAFRDAESKISLLTLDLAKANERLRFSATTFDLLNSEFDRVKAQRDSLAAEVPRLKDEVVSFSKMLSIMREERDSLADQLGKAIIRQANPDCPACTRKGIRITELLSNNEAIKGAFRGEIYGATHARILAEQKLAAYKKAHPARKAKK